MDAAAGGPLPSTHTIWLHFTYDSKHDPDLLKAFTLTQGRLLPHAEILDIINAPHPIEMMIHDGEAEKGFPANTFSQDWLNSSMGMTAAPPHLLKFPFVVSATPINYRGAGSGELRLSTILEGTALCAPPIDSMADYGVPAPDR
jgi:hypothetical protein